MTDNSSDPTSPSIDPAPRARRRIDGLGEDLRFEKTLVNPPDPGNEVRRGSPFQAGTATTAATTSILEPVSLADWAPESSVARAAVWASAMVLFFAGVSSVVFPVGGLLTAGLGCGLAVAGLFSTRVIAAGGLLALHSLLFFRCVSQTL